MHLYLSSAKCWHLFWFMSNSEVMRSVSDRFDVTLSSLFRIIQRVTNACISMWQQYIKWPTGTPIKKLSRIYCILSLLFFLFYRNCYILCCLGYQITRRINKQTWYCLQKLHDFFTVGLELVKITGEMQLEHEKPVGTFQPGKRDYILSSSTFSGNFPVGRTEKNVFHLAPNRNFRNFWPNGKRPNCSQGTGAWNLHWLSQRLSSTIHMDAPFAMLAVQAPVVQRAENSIQRISRYPTDKMYRNWYILSTG